MSGEKQSVTCFLESDNEILILLRSDRVSTYRGVWGGVSGAIDKGKTPDEQAVLEIEEEAGLSAQDIQMLKRGEPLVFFDPQFGVHKIVHPYLFHVKDRSRVRIDWEHRQAKWIKAADIDKYPTMPMLKESLESVLIKREIKE